VILVLVAGASLAVFFVFRVPHARTNINPRTYDALLLRTPLAVERAEAESLLGPPTGVSLGGGSETGKHENAIASELKSSGRGRAFTSQYEISSGDTIVTWQVRYRDNWSVNHLDVEAVYDSHGKPLGISAGEWPEPPGLVERLLTTLSSWPR
jgi:hypothetical protein